MWEIDHNKAVYRFCRRGRAHELTAEMVSARDGAMHSHAIGELLLDLWPDCHLCTTLYRTACAGHLSIFAHISWM